MSKKKPTVIIKHHKNETFPLSIKRVRKRSNSNPERFCRNLAELVHFAKNLNIKEDNEVIVVKDLKGEIVASFESHNLFDYSHIRDC